jgi:hypothetical protein
MSMNKIFFSESINKSYVIQSINHNVKRKFYQRWSIPPILTTKGTVTTHLSTLNAKIKTMTQDVGYPGSRLGRTQ